MTCGACKRRGYNALGEYDWAQGSQGLGELLPPQTGASAADVKQYAALASGQAVGGNYQHFKDAAELGWFTDDAAGYANYLGYNTQGSAVLKPWPEYFGLMYAHIGAYGLITNATFSPDGWVKIALQAIRGTYANDPAALATAEASFATNFPRVLAKWGYNGKKGVLGGVTPSSGNRLWASIYNKWLYEGTDYSRYTTDQYGNITLFDLNGKQTVTFGTGPGGIDPGEAARKAAADAATYKPGILILTTTASPPSPGDGINFATLAWRPMLIGPLGQKGNGAWQRWTTGLVHRSNDPQVMIVSIEDAKYDFQSGNPIWDWATLQGALAGGFSVAPPSTITQSVVTDPTTVKAAIPSGSIPVPDSTPKPGTPPPDELPVGATKNPWTDVTAQPPTPVAPPIGGGSSTAPPTFSSASGGGIINTDDPAPRNPADALPALGKSVLLLAGIGLLMLMKGRRNR